jgi:F0F1-type ATP synthase assembly protein I
MIRWGNCIDGSEVSFGNQKKTRKTNTNKIKKKKEKQTKEAETSKGRNEKRTRLMSAWTLLREFFRGLPGRLLRESEG